MGPVQCRGKDPGQGRVIVAHPRGPGRTLATGPMAGCSISSISRSISRRRRTREATGPAARMQIVLMPASAFAEATRALAEVCVRIDSCAANVPSPSQQASVVSTGLQPQRKDALFHTVIKIWPLKDSSHLLITYIDIVTDQECPAQSCQSSLAASAPGFRQLPELILGHSCSFRRLTLKITALRRKTLSAHLYGHKLNKAARPGARRAVVQLS